MDKNVARTMMILHNTREVCKTSTEAMTVGEMEIAIKHLTLVTKMLDEVIASNGLPNHERVTEIRKEALAHIEQVRGELREAREQPENDRYEQKKQMNDTTIAMIETAMQILMGVEAVLMMFGEWLPVDKVATSRANNILKMVVEKKCELTPDDLGTIATDMENDRDKFLNMATKE